ncbi:MAG: thioredoxin domain-containing protein [Gemmatimonadetes bacterium]|nr:thioredoxin domain-containing protein [Gemmatimonadota bacterium]
MIAHAGGWWIVQWSILWLAFPVSWRQSYPSLDGVGHDSPAAQAAIEVAEFLDFGCPECARFAAEVLPTLTAEFVSPGRVRWKTIPYVSGAFPHSREAAVAAECAGEQGAFPAMHDRLFAGQREWSRGRRPDSVLIGYAAAMALDTAGFAACFRGPEARARVRLHDKLAREYRVRGTPTFYLNRTRRIEGALPLAPFRELLQTATGNDAARSPSRR